MKLSIVFFKELSHIHHPSIKGCSRWVGSSDRLPACLPAYPHHTILFSESVYLSWFTIKMKLAPNAFQQLFIRGIHAYHKSFDDWWSVLIVFLQFNPDFHNDFICSSYNKTSKSSVHMQLMFEICWQQRVSDLRLVTMIPIGSLAGCDRILEVFQVLFAAM